MRPKYKLVPSAWKKALCFLLLCAFLDSKCAAQCHFASNSTTKRLTYTFEPLFLDEKLTLRVTVKYRKALLRFRGTSRELSRTFAIRYAK